MEKKKRILCKFTLRYFCCFVSANIGPKERKLQLETTYFLYGRENDRTIQWGPRSAVENGKFHFARSIAFPSVWYPCLCTLIQRFLAPAPGQFLNWHCVVVFLGTTAFFVEHIDLAVYLFWLPIAWKMEKDMQKNPKRVLCVDVVRHARYFVPKRK